MIRPATLSGVIKGAGIVGLITILVRILSFGREVAAAAMFGVGADLDVFLIAYLVPSFLFYAILGCAGAAIIPALIEARQRGGEDGLRALIARANGAGVIGFCLLGLLAALAAPLYLPLLTSHLTPGKIALAQIWLPLLCLLVPLYGLAALWTAIANSQGNLALPACIPVLSPIVTIYMLYNYAQLHGAWAFANGMLLGAALEVVALGILLRWRGLLPWPRLPGKWDTGFERGFAILFAGTAIMGLIPATDQAMATSIGTGAITGIIFGGRLVSLTGSVGALALGAAVLPAFAALAAEMDWARLRQMMGQCVALTLGLAIPLCLFISWFSLPLVEILFQRGQFSFDDARMVASVQAPYILQIPFYLGWIVVARALAAMGHNFLILLLSAGAALLNMILNYFFMQAAGVAGIAAATSATFFLLLIAALAVFYYLPPRAAQIRVL
ncbi:MAG: putative peptidoglycan lipid II flippase [Alphaproteobacteria bacterium]|nr:putative peptidoglycan lipid II flippase [Alphaproteobacteria bacterium]